MISQDEFGLRSYGGFDQPSKGMWLQNPRRRMNIIPIIFCIVLPWALFVAVFALMSFSFHYQCPTLTTVCTFALLLAVLCIGAKAWFGRRDGVERGDPSWLIFLAASLIVAWIVGYVMGGSNFASNTKDYYDLQNLNSYSNVYPNRMLGQQLMDAGVVSFASGTKLDISKSMGFKNSVMYCVAPIVFGKETPLSYDFWAVGTECCSGGQPDFHCANYNNPQANGGVRLLDSGGDKAFYRLAVQQAEATYNIKAATPVFFTWGPHPSEKMQAHLSHAKESFVAWMMSYLVFQIFVVAMASIVFNASSK